AGNDRAGRTASNDDIVIRSLGLRLIERLGFAGGQRLLHRCGRKPAGKTSRARAHQEIARARLTTCRVVQKDLYPLAEIAHVVPALGGLPLPKTMPSRVF